MEQIYSETGMYPYPGNTSQPLNKDDNALFYSVQETKDGFHYTPFGLTIGDAFKSYNEALLYGARDPINNAKTGLTQAEEKILSASGNQYGTIYYTHGLCRDTSLGGNDALNCYYGYNRDDDIAHPFHITAGNVHQPQVFMGRVYAERINALQSIMYLGFGIPKFNNMSGFWDNFYSKPMGEAAQQGLWGTLSTFMSWTVGLPFRAIRACAQYYILVANGKIRAPVTKYYAFQSQMPAYYLQVQSLLVTLATNMELIHGINPTEGETQANSAQLSNSPYASGLQQHFSWMYGSNIAIDETGTPIKDSKGNYVKGNLDLNFFALMLKKVAYTKLDPHLIEQAQTFGWAQQLLQLKTQQDTRQTAATSYTGAMAAGAKGTVKEAKEQANLWKGLFIWQQTDVNPFAKILQLAAKEEFLFIGFRVERGTNASDAITTSTQPSPVQTKINSLLYKFREGHFTLMGNQSGGIVGNVLSALGYAANFASSLVGVGPFAAAASGFSNADIPEIWEDTRFSRSYSFNMEFVAGYGNPLSVFQDLYVPLCALLAGALPRSTGISTYTSPFYVHAYCRGKFSIPMGMIDSISIERGSSTHGWSHVHLPLSLNVSFTIKDLTPSTPLSMLPIGFKGEIQNLMDAIATADTSLNQYLMVLAGMGPREMLSPQIAVANRLAVSLSILNDTFSPTYVAASVGQWRAVRQLYKLLYPTKSPLLPWADGTGGDGDG
ncbi:MAG: hypothetical protein IIT65_01500 [Lachnospiraceae bacterium]|nr:hypothetical protein [Lachnospiraceae bacterium]